MRGHYDFGEKLRKLHDNSRGIIVIRIVLVLPSLLFAGIEDDVKREHLQSELVLPRRKVFLGLPSEVRSNLPCRGNRDNNILIIGIRIDGLFDVEIVIPVDFLALVRFRMYGILAVQCVIERGQPLLSVKNQLIGLDVGIGVGTLYRLVLEVYTLVPVLKEHGCADREVMNHAEYQCFDASVIPYPASLEVRQLCHTAVYCFH